MRALGSLLVASVSLSGALCLAAPHHFERAGLEVEFPVGWTTTVDEKGQVHATSADAAGVVSAWVISSKTGSAFVDEVKGHLAFGMRIRWEKAAHTVFNGQSASVVRGRGADAGKVVSIELVRVDSPVKGAQLFLMIATTELEAHRAEWVAFKNSIRVVAASAP